MGLDGLERLMVWKKAKAFAVAIYREVIPLLPSEEKWGLGDQLRRAAQSIPANLAEGHGRFYYQDNVRFAYIARGSLEECFSHLSLARELGFIPAHVYDKAVHDGDEVYRLISGYIAYLKQSRRGEKEPGAPRGIAEEVANYDPDFELLAPRDRPGLED